MSRKPREDPQPTRCDWSHPDGQLLFSWCGQHPVTAAEEQWEAWKAWEKRHPEPSRTEALRESVPRIRPFMRSHPPGCPACAAVRLRANVPELRLKGYLTPRQQLRRQAYSEWGPTIRGEYHRLEWARLTFRLAVVALLAQHPQEGRV